MAEQDRCTNHYHALISAYLDGEIDPTDRADLLRHLSTCADCRATMQEYRAIGGKIRAMQAQQPPADLTSAIYRETIGSRRRRIFLLSSRVGYSIAAAAAVFLVFIVAAYLIFIGYQRSIDPTVVASQPGSNVVWPQHRPVEITFNKEMDHDSVSKALTISPSSEKDRLALSWNGNTLIIGQNQTLKPGASYMIRVGTAATDRWGQHLSQPFQVSFETSRSVTQIETPTPEPPTPTPTRVLSPTPSATETEAPPTATSSENRVVPPTQPPAATATATEPPADTQAPPASSDNNAVPPPPTATPVPPEPTATATSTPSPTATETPTPAPTETPEPTATPVPPTETPVPPTPTASPEPEVTASPGEIPVTDAFGSVYWGTQKVQDLLGAPLASAASESVHELDFQHGAMILRPVTQQVYVIEFIGVWSQFSAPGGDDPDPVPGEFEGTWEPGGAIGRAWQSEPWIRDAVGMALAEQATVFDSTVQNFEGGMMLLSHSGQIYVFYNDGTWELYSAPAS